MVVGAFSFLADKTTMGLQWIVRQFESLKNKIWSSVYGYLKPKIDNPIIVIDSGSRGHLVFCQTYLACCKMAVLVYGCC